MTEKQHHQTKQTQNKYRFVMKKGSGAFADVVQAENIRTGQMVAIKRMKQTYKNIEQIQQLREIQSLRQLRHHPNIVQLLEILFDKKTGKLALVFELLSHDMYQTIRHKKQQLPVNQVKWYMFQVINGLRGLHQAGYFHRDVKPENVLIKRMPRAESWTGDIIKLSDLGSARPIGSQLPYTEYISTRWYRPPETLLSDGVYGQEMDIFGTGCVLYEMIELKPIFPGRDELDQLQRIHGVMGTPTPQVLKYLRAGAKVNPIQQEFQPQQGCGVEKLMTNPPKGAAKLIEAMLTYDPRERITAEQAMASEYFDDIPELIKEIRNAGFIDEAYLNQMEAAWTEVRGAKAPIGKQKTTMRAPANTSFDRSPRAQATNSSGSFSPIKKIPTISGTTGSSTTNATVQHKAKKMKMKQSTLSTINNSINNMYPKPEQISLSVKPLVAQPQQLPQLKKKYIYKVGK